MIALDFAAYYHQFELAEDVGRRMCFSWNQRFYRLKRLAMGQRQSVDVACAATARFLDFEHKSRRVSSIIDNVLFIGKRDDVIEDAWTFVRRCHQAGATLNELDVRTATRDTVAGLVRQNGNWGGVHIDLIDKSVALMPKIVEKTALSWSRRASWQWRHFAAHIGLLFWSWGITDLPMAEFFPILRFISHVGTEATKAHDRVRAALGLPADAMPPNPFWDETASVWQSAMPALERWTALVLANKPRVVKPQRVPDVIFECDASLWGWCCYALELKTGETLIRHEPWSVDMRRRFGDKLAESTTAEPFGLLFSLVAVHKHFPNATSFGATNDNTVAVASHRRGYNGRSWSINECMRIRDEVFPRETFEFWTKHVAGILNLADRGSRGGRVDHFVMSEGEIEILRSRWGFSAQTATTTTEVG